MSGRILVLKRFKNGIEYPHDPEHENIMTAVLKFREIMYARLKDYSGPLLTSYIVAPNGGVLIVLFDEFPNEELPLNGGISEFEADGFLYKFESEGADDLAALSYACRLHKANKCKKNLCYEQSCENYNGALDDQLFLRPSSVFFFRYTPSSPTDKKPCKQIDMDKPVVITNKEGTEVLSDYNRVVPIGLDEYMIHVSNPANFLDADGEVRINGSPYEILPIPSDASQLDMHLAQLSGLDARYVLRFTNEVKHMFDETQHKPYDLVGPEDDSFPEDEEFSNDEDSYVQSALVPGLRQCDFNHAADMGVVLGQLTVSESEEKRLRALIGK